MKYVFYSIDRRKEENKAASCRSSYYRSDTWHCPIVDWKESKPAQSILPKRTPPSTIVQVWCHFKGLFFRCASISWFQVVRFTVFTANTSTGLSDYLHTSYLSRTPRICSCKFFLAGVNFTDLTRKIAFSTDFTRKSGVFFYRFDAKDWRFSV